MYFSTRLTLSDSEFRALSNVADLQYIEKSTYLLICAFYVQFIKYILLANSNLTTSDQSLLQH